MKCNIYNFIVILLFSSSYLRYFKTSSLLMRRDQLSRHFLLELQVSLNFKKRKNVLKVPVKKYRVLAGDGWIPNVGVLLDSLSNRWNFIRFKTIQSNRNKKICKGDWRTLPFLCFLQEYRGYYFLELRKISFCPGILLMLRFGWTFWKIDKWKICRMNLWLA